MPALAVERVYRREHARGLATLVRRFGDWNLAEDALQDAYAKALSTWSGEGLPDRPGAWLATVAQNHALDRLRRRRHAAHGTGDPGGIDGIADPFEPGSIDEGIDSGVADDRLRLLYTCCHPALAPAAQCALALRTLCGLHVRAIARAYLEPEATTAQRLVRAKRKIMEARIPYEVPAAQELPARTSQVLSVVYLVFNEGYAATDGELLVRDDLCGEAIRLGRLVAELLPRHAEARGLLALMLLHDARRDARMDAAGALVPLEEQDRDRWHRARIREAVALLDSALPMRAPGPYQIQAAIASLHAQARRAQDTDWKQIFMLYGALIRHLPTPVVELNAAVAFAMVEGPLHGLAWLDRLEARGELANYHLLPAARADLLRRAGRHAEARVHYQVAVSLARNAAERAYLQRRILACP